jgi:hypothetical protein
MLSLTVLAVGCDPGGPDDSTTTTTSEVHSGAFHREPCDRGGFGNHGGGGTNGAAGKVGSAGSSGEAGKLGSAGSSGEAGKLGHAGTSGSAGAGGSAPACPPPPSGIVSWWHADGNYNDAVGSNNGATGGDVTFAAGEINQGFQLDGTAASYVVVPNAPSLNVTSALTIDAWINSPTMDGRIVDKITAFEGDGYLLDVAGGQLRLLVGGDGIGSPAVIVENVLTHVAGVYDGANLSLYVNGTLVATKATAVTAIPVNGNPLHIGADSTGSTNFTGLIDEPRVFNRALSAAEIAAVFQAESSHCQ